MSKILVSSPYVMLGDLKFAPPFWPFLALSLFSVGWCSVCLEEERFASDI